MTPRDLMSHPWIHPDFEVASIDWRAVIVKALALAYVLLCGLVVLWWLA